MEKYSNAMKHDEIDHYIQNAKFIRSEAISDYVGELAHKVQELTELASVKLHGLFSAKSGLKKV